MIKDESEINSFAHLYTCYHKRSYLFVKSYIHNDLAAEDIASEVLIKAWEMIQSGRALFSKSWLLTMLKNRAIDHIKHEMVRMDTANYMEMKEKRELQIRISTLEACNPHEMFSSEVTGIIQQTLELLPPKTRTIFYMSRFDEKSNKEIAQTLSMSVKNVEYHISQALKLFRSNLKEYLPLYLFFFI